MATIIDSLSDDELIDLRVALAEGRYSVIPAAIPWNQQDSRQIARLCESVATDIQLKRERTQR